MLSLSSVMLDSLRPHGRSPPGSSVHGLLQASHTLLQGIVPTQGLNPGLPYCRRILYQLSHRGSQSILEWVAYPFSSGSSQPRNRSGVSCIAGRFFTNLAVREDNGKEPACQCRKHRKCRFDPWVWKIPWRRGRLPTPVF